MLEFAADTGLTDSSREPRRYLWTDSFAVCNFLTLYRRTGEQKYQDLALRLVDQVHETLGKHHPDSQQTGWLSGLSDKEAQRHTTRGGLRIGKKIKERQPDEPYDEAREWDRDGQYFHYLTKWMHALSAVSGVTGDAKYLAWAKELAKTAYVAFTYTPVPGGETRMYWKMSIDLSRPLVSSMGQHDPLDGLATFLELEAASKRLLGCTDAPSLETEINELSQMCVGKHWATEDALGIGGLLVDTWILMSVVNSPRLPDGINMGSLLSDIEHSLHAFLQNNSLNLPAGHRLAFRELGLSIGLQALNKMDQTLQLHANDFQHTEQLRSTLERLIHVEPLHELIEKFWLDPPNQAVDAWREHKDINSVMLATSLAPDGFLVS